MSDNVKVNFAEMQNTIDKIDMFIKKLSDEENNIATIKENMERNWGGNAAQDAYDVIGSLGAVSISKETILSSIHSMIEIQSDVKRMLQEKLNGFVEARTGF